MKLKTRKATSSYETDEQLAAAVMSRMGKQVKEAYANNPRYGADYGRANVKEWLANEIKTRRAILEERGFGDVSNRKVLDSLGSSEIFRSREERASENATKGFIRTILGGTVDMYVDEKGNVKYSGFAETKSGRYVDWSTGKFISGENLGKQVKEFSKYGFVPGKTQLVYNPMDNNYMFRGENGIDYVVEFQNEYTDGAITIKEA